MPFLCGKGTRINANSLCEALRCTSVQPCAGLQKSTRRPNRTCYQLRITGECRRTLCNFIHKTTPARCCISDCQIRPDDQPARPEIKYTSMTPCPTKKTPKIQWRLDFVVGPVLQPPPIRHFVGKPCQVTYTKTLRSTNSPVATDNKTGIPIRIVVRPPTTPSAQGVHSRDDFNKEFREMVGKEPPKDRRKAFQMLLEAQEQSTADIQSLRLAIASVKEQQHRATQKQHTDTSSPQTSTPPPPTSPPHRPQLTTQFQHHHQSETYPQAHLQAQKKCKHSGKNVTTVCTDEDFCQRKKSKMPVRLAQYPTQPDTNQKPPEIPNAVAGANLQTRTIFAPSLTCTWGRVLFGCMILCMHHMFFSFLGPLFYC